MAYTNDLCLVQVHKKVSLTVEKIHCHLWSSLPDIFCLIYVCNFHEQVFPM